MTFFTLKGPARWEETIRRSRFLTVADTAHSPEQALSFIDANSVADATHNCWAYQIGDEYRFSDDGEPGGTAGRPILQAIQGQQYDRVVVLVVRWFGGTKLGTGGLVRAYSGCAAKCLQLADKTKLVDQVVARCFCPFPDLALVQSRFSNFDIVVNDETFGTQGVAWELSVPTHYYDDFKDQFINQTRGQGDCHLVDPDALLSSPD